MKRDENHNDFIERWLIHMKENPNWRDEHRAFINSQIISANKSLERLGKLKGREVLINIRNIKNQNIFDNLKIK